MRFINGILISALLFALAGCATDYSSKTISGVEIPKTAAGICSAFYDTAQVGKEEEPSVDRVEARYGSASRWGYPGWLEIAVYGKDKDGVPLWVKSYEGGKLPPTVPMFVDEHMSYRGGRITVICGGRQGERAFDVQRGKKGS